MTSEPGHGKRTDAVANHARILEAARLALIEHGLDLEVNEVADRAGVGVGTLYRHFANRDEMVRAVVMGACDAVIVRLRNVADIEDPHMALRQIPLTLVGDQCLFAVMQDPRSAKFMRDVKQISQPMVDEIVALVAAIVERGMRTGTFRADLDPPTTAAAILGSIAAVFEALGRKKPLADLATLVSDLHEHMVAVH